MAEELNTDIMQIYGYEYSYTDNDGETVTSSGKIWANSKEHADQLTMERLKSFEGMKNIKVTITDADAAKE